MNSIRSSERFKREEHLKRRNEIKEVFGRGRQYYCHGAKLFVLKNNLPYNRICFTLSGGFGNAVNRNRAKRLGRESYRLMKRRLCTGYDLVLLVYPNEHGVNKDLNMVKTVIKKTVLLDRIKQLEFLFSKAGLIGSAK